MLPERTMAHTPASKQTSAAASKIKNRILNTSSFFKVSLKTNNKALALALAAQKERSRQLEKEIVYLQKQVEALCFELATKKYKHRKLLLIFKNLHNSALQHLNMAADLFSDSDLPKLAEDDKALPGDIDKGNLVVGSPTDQLPPQPEISGALLCPLQKVPVDLPEENLCADVFNKDSTDTSNDNTDSEGRQCIQSPQTSRPSSSLRDEVVRLSMMFSQSGFDMDSILGLQNSQPPSAVSTCEKPKPPLSDGAHLPSSSVMETEPERHNKQEKTVLLNTTMEMTVTNATEIVTVETKAKKRGKLKGKKNKEQGCVSSKAEDPQVTNSADCELSKVQSAPTGALLQTDDHALEDIRAPEVIELQSPKTQCMSVITSRIPKSEDGKNQKRKKDKLKSHDQTKSKTESTDTDSLDLDDYFMDPRITFSRATENLKVQPEKDTAEEVRSKITCRRSRTKGRRASSVTRRTFVTLPLPLHESESSQSKLEQVCNEVEDEHVSNKPQSKMKTATNSGERHKSRCRGTFVVSVPSPEVDHAEQDLRASTGSLTCEAEEPSIVTDTSISRQHSESNPHGYSDGPSVQETQSSCKRPWLATQDSGSPQDDMSSNDNHEVLPLDQECTSGTEFQKPKKAKREEMSQSGKKKAVQREDHLNDRKKKTKSSRSNKGLRSEEEGCDRGDSIDGPEINKELFEDLQVVNSQSDFNEKDDIFGHLYDSKPSQSKSRMERNPKRCRNASKLHAPTEPRNPRETFVVYRRRTQDNSSLSNTRTSDMSHSTNSHLMDTSDEAVHENLGGLLMDELPPWLAVDVSTADTEVGSLLATPKRETSRRTAVIEESAAVTTEASPAGRVLTSLTNTMTTPDSENRGRTRRRNGVVSYKEPALNSKIRRGDKFTESTFLSSPVFKDGKKKKQKKTAANPKLESSIFMD